MCVRMHAYALNYIWLFAMPWTVAHQAPLSMESPKEGKNCHFLLQGIFWTQGSNPHLLHLLHGQADSLLLKHLGSTLPLVLIIVIFDYNYWKDQIQLIYVKHVEQYLANSRHYKMLTLLIYIIDISKNKEWKFRDFFKNCTTSWWQNQGAEIPRQHSNSKNDDLDFCLSPSLPTRL